MCIEIAIALRFLTSHLYTKLPRRRVNMFAEELGKQLRLKYQNHWHHDRPYRGSGYRSLKFNFSKIDKVIHDAIKEAGLEEREILECLPNDMIIWIDPGEVSYRIGERGQVVVLYKKDSADSSSDQQINNDSYHVNMNKPNISEDDSGCCSSTSQPPVSESGVSARSASNMSPLNENSDAKHSQCFDMSSLRSYGNTCVSSSSSGYESSNASYRSSPVFTTASFAQTKFGSTKLKSNSRRYSRMLPDEFSEYIKQRSQLSQYLSSKHHHQHSHEKLSNPNANKNSFHRLGYLQSHYYNDYSPNNYDIRSIRGAEALSQDEYQSNLSGYKYKDKTHFQRYSYAPSVFSNYRHKKYQNIYTMPTSINMPITPSQQQPQQQQPIPHMQPSLALMHPAAVSDWADDNSPNLRRFSFDNLTNFTQIDSSKQMSPTPICRYCAAISSLDNYNGSNVNYGNYNSGSIYCTNVPSDIHPIHMSILTDEVQGAGHLSASSTPSDASMSPQTFTHTENGLFANQYHNNVQSQRHQSNNDFKAQQDEHLKPYPTFNSTSDSPMKSTKYIFPALPYQPNQPPNLMILNIHDKDHSYEKILSASRSASVFHEQSMNMPDFHTGIYSNLPQFKFHHRQSHCNKSNDNIINSNLRFMPTINHTHQQISLMKNGYFPTL